MFCIFIIIIIYFLKYNRQLLYIFTGLGPTVAELKLKENNIEAIAKTQFSMCVPPVIEAINKNDVSTSV